MKNLAMTKRKLQIYSDKYSDKRLSPEKKVQATFESVDRTRILAERAQPHLGHQDSKVRNLETSLGFTVPNYTIVTAKHFEEYHLFEMNLCLTRGDLAERLIESLYFGDPLNNKECDQIVRSWSVFGDERRIPTSSKNPENRLTAEFVEKMAERAGWDSFPDRTLYHCALLLRALPRPGSDELRLHYHQLIERRKSGKSNLSSARREKLRPSVLLLDDFLRDAACLPGYLREFERRAHLEALLSFLQKIWSACVRLTSKTTSFVKFACATSDVQELPS